MSDQTDNIYRFSSLAGYPLKKRLVIRFADIAFYLLIRLIGVTVSFETKSSENLEAATFHGKLPIYTTWHDRIFLGTYFFQNRGIVFLASQSSDGEYIARLLQRFGYGVIRGSSTRGGARGLVEMIRAMKSGLAMGFTIDGPRGPRHEAKPGPIILAKKTGNPILPFVIEPKRFWTVNSWDKMQIPLPFSKALTIFGEPIYVDNDASRAEIGRKLKELQKSLDDMTEQGKAWSGRLD